MSILVALWASVLRWRDAFLARPERVEQLEREVAKLQADIDALTVERDHYRELAMDRLLVIDSFERQERTSVVPLGTPDPPEFDGFSRGPGMGGPEKRAVPYTPAPARNLAAGQEARRRAAQAALDCAHINAKAR
jgi:hypothetical protein